uniref:Ig-like domain-containing protein n=1 Tax=Scleropages formosus TaxID=113540 RepID=A0A8C9VAK3_SCLFO
DSNQIRSHGISISQIPHRMMLRAGQTADINCTQSTSNANMYWYQQKTGGPLRFLFYTVNSDEATEKGDGIPDRFSVSRKSVEKTSLKITRVQAADTAVYYCASSPQFIIL